MQKIPVVILLCIIQIILVCFCAHKMKGKIYYALLIGGGVTERDNFESYYKNIVYVSNILKKIGYRDKDIKILFYKGNTPYHPIVESEATKENFINELRELANIIDSNDSLLIFRSGHGKVNLVFDKFANNRHGFGIESVKCIGTISFMRFPDGDISHLEFQEILKNIGAKQIVVILNQCFAGQFADITESLNNTVVISETDKSEFAINDLRRKSDEWAFVKCLFDGFLQNGTKGQKQSVYNAFQYMLRCNPCIEGIPVQADRPLLKEHPQIKYGSELEKGSVYID